MTITEQMIKQFYEAKVKIAKILIEKKNMGRVTTGLENAQFYCNEIYSKLLEMVSKDTPRMIEENMQGLKNSMQYSIANVLANNQIGDLVKAILNAQRVTDYVIGRLNDDAYRNLTLEQVAIINSGGFSVPMAQKFLMETLEKENVPCFVDKLGRVWSMDVYTNMAIRTGSRQSRNAGMLTADDHDLYYVVPIGSTCPVCAVLEGRVYSKSGKSPYYPPLTELYGKIDEAGANDLTNSYLTIHPNCRHTLVKWNEDTKTEEEIEEMRERSSFAKHPKDINPQTKKEMEEYRASQREKAKFRGMLNEYRKIQAQKVEDLPKNFQTFITNKEHDTENYQWWKLEYRFNKKKNEQGDIQIVQKAIKGGKILDKINTEKQERHQKGTEAENKSYMDCSIEKTEEIYRINRGKGLQYIGKDGSIKETIITKNKYGRIKKQDKETKKTNIYKIHYSKTGSHIVPKEVL